jgi:hypothetical protein
LSQNPESPEGATQRGVCFPSSANKSPWRSHLGLRQPAALGHWQPAADNRRRPFMATMNLENSLACLLNSTNLLFLCHLPVLCHFSPVIILDKELENPSVSPSTSCPSLHPIPSASHTVYTTHPVSSLFLPPGATAHHFKTVNFVPLFAPRPHLSLVPSPI